MSPLKPIIEKLKAYKETLVIVVCVLGWIITISVARGIAMNETSHEVKRVDELVADVKELGADRQRFIESMIRIETLLEAMDARTKLLEKVLVPPSLRPQP